MHAGSVALLLELAGAHAGAQTRYRLECPLEAPAEWGGPRGQLVGVQVLSAKRGEVIDETAPPDLIPNRQTTHAGVVRQTWRMNADGPDWLYYVWCRYAGTDRVLRLAAPNVKRCERTFQSAHPDRPAQRMVCD